MAEFSIIKCCVWKSDMSSTVISIHEMVTTDFRNYFICPQCISTRFSIRMPLYYYNYP